MTCTHGHTGIQAIACTHAEEIAEEIGAKGAPTGIAVIISPSEGAGGVAAFSNLTAYAHMAKLLCEAALDYQRPANCETCAAAHDRLSLALAALRDAAPARC